MVDADVVLEKVAQIQNALRRIHEKVASDTTKLRDMDTQDIVILNLQRAIQSTIDLAAHIVSDEGLGLPDTLRENFVLLERGQIISPALSEAMQAMIGFRNIAIHDYTAINPIILASVIEHHLKDFEEFYSTIARHFRIAGA